MQRSRILQTLNGDPAASPLGGAHRLGAPYSSHRAPQKVCLENSLAAALPGKGASLGEEAVLADSGRAGEVAAGDGRVRSLVCLNIQRECTPACGAMRGDHRSSAVSKWFFRRLRSLENCCYRSFASVASNVFILLKVFSSPAHLPVTIRADRAGRWSLTVGRANEVQIGIRGGPT